MSSTKNRSGELHTDHFVSGKDRRAERRNSNLLRHANDLDADEWDDVDLAPKEQRFRKNQKLD